LRAVVSYLVVARRAPTLPLPTPRRRSEPLRIA
jgi:hypothetical protein